MVTHMKTTIELSDALLKAARRRAQARGMTLRSLVEEGLRRVLREDQGQTPFRLRNASFEGKGLAPEVGEWTTIREAIYRGRGT
jgi:hypothetical protein